MKGLEYLGKIFKSYTKSGSLTRDISKEIRRNINPEKICSRCLNDYQHQTKDGEMLCNQCYEEYKNNKE